MKTSIAKIALVSFTLLLSASLSSAADNKSTTAQATTNKAGTSTTNGKPKKEAAPSKITLIDINSAKKAELKTLPGITDADAAKIVASRPFGSKAWLVSDNILTQERYLAISKLVVAKQPYKDAAKNAALYKNKN